MNYRQLLSEHTETAVRGHECALGAGWRIKEHLPSLLVMSGRLSPQTERTVHTAAPSFSPQQSQSLCKAVPLASTLLFSQWSYSLSLPRTVACCLFVCVHQTLSSSPQVPTYTWRRREWAHERNHSSQISLSPQLNGDNTSKRVPYSDKWFSFFS